ncbi:hypothetical protein [Streptomyces thermospinosisporus]|uniref:hypothetical protein n=1 Tax=Streptomyces thermospinosisporus TaxID=161482 RepID=UPI0031E02C2A
MFRVAVGGEQVFADVGEVLGQRVGEADLKAGALDRPGPTAFSPRKGKLTEQVTTR